MDRQKCTIYRPKYLFHKGEFRDNFELSVDAQGVIAGVNEVEKTPEKANKAKVIRLEHEALVPGLVNVHSHAFQRMLRGSSQKNFATVLPGERRRPASSEDFWSWREQMYALVRFLTPEHLYAASLFCFLEMLRSGITTVGEFHYLHHALEGKPYRNRNELGLAVLAAAEEAGIRICLLDCLYERGGYQKSLSPAQKRFCDTSPEAYLKRFSELQKEIKGKQNQTLGLSLHSVRAVSATGLTEVASYCSQARDVWPLHMHLQEQPAEIEECKAEYAGLHPIAVVDEHGLLSPRFTAVHFIHANGNDRRLLAAAKAAVCACPTTERDLGDGILDAESLEAAEVPVSLGTDSQIQINLWEDARELEYHLRLKSLRRNILGQPTALHLFHSATVNGARALQIHSGELLEDRLADFITLDLNHLSLVGADKAGLLTQMIFSMETGAIKDVFVGGKKVIREGEHPYQKKISEGFRKVMQEFNNR